MGSLENTMKTRPKSAQHAFQPVYYFSRCAGLWPFRIICDSNGSIKAARIHLFDIFWSLILICLYWTGLLYAYNDVMDAGTQLSKMYFIIHVPPLLFGPVCIILDVFNHKRLVNIVDRFIVFDREVRVLYFYTLLSEFIVAVQGFKEG